MSALPQLPGRPMSPCRSGFACRPFSDPARKDYREESNAAGNIYPCWQAVNERQKSQLYR